MAQSIPSDSVVFNPVATEYHTGRSDLSSKEMSLCGLQ